MIKKLFAYAVASVLFLSGCGGGGTNTIVGQPSTGTGSTAAVASVTVQSSAAQIPADNSTSAIVTALVKDANNNAIQGVAVAFAVSSGSIAVTQATTDANGLATGTVGTGGVATVRTITVTATAGGKSGTATVAVANIQQTIVLLTDLPQIPSDGSKSATITALVKDANNQFIKGVNVNFTTSAGGIQVTQATTDDKGAAIGILSPPPDKKNQTITVTATAGASSTTINLDVVGTKLNVVGPSSLVLNGQGTYTVSLTDSSNHGIAGQTISLSSAASNTLSASAVTTDSTGQKIITLTAAHAGSDTLTVTSLGLQAQQAIAVSSENFNFTAPAANTQVPLGAPGVTLTLKWLSGSTPQANKMVTVASTRGTVTPATSLTDSTGSISVNVQSTTAGPATISASSAGVSAQLAIEFVATVASSIDLQTSPATIPTQGQSNLIAVVRDPQNNLVANKTVTFQLIDITGGSLSVATAVTDLSGRAQTVYTGSTTPSGSNGVSVTATVQEGASTLTATKTITVGGQTVFLSLGTGNHIGENTDQTQFIVPYVVQALDSAGNAVNNVPITLTIHSLPPGPNSFAYAKGAFTVGATASGSNAWIQHQSAYCRNEDANGNGVLDTNLHENDGPDSNNDAFLTPGDKAVTDTGVVTTTGSGSASFNVVYPESFALWVQVRLTATATVQGTETSTSATFWLPILATYLTTTTESPPNEFSPFGQSASCNDAL
jgi:hypothetical protein